MYSDRIALYKKLESKLKTCIVAYVTSTRQGMETQIASDIVDFMTNHLDAIYLTPSFKRHRKITLILHTNGGVTLSGWSIVNLIRMFCDQFHVIIPSKALSTGTLICLGADTIYMTKQAVLGPIDPSTNGPFNPQFPEGSGNLCSMSVEHVAGYFDMVREQISNSADLNAIFLKLADKVHPLALGNVQRARNQIKMLAERLLKFHMSDDKKIRDIIRFLCVESGSHDYTMNRREALALGLPIEKPDMELYKIIKAIYDDISKELELSTPYNQSIILGTNNNSQYSCTRGLVESLKGGCHKYLSKGLIAINNNAILDQRLFEGWTHEQDLSK